MNFNQAITGAALAAYMFGKPFCVVSSPQGLDFVDMERAEDGRMTILKTVEPVEEGA